MFRPGCRTLAIAFLLPVLATPGRTFAVPADDNAAAQRHTYTLVPETQLYPYYIADPYRSDFALQLMTALESQIPQTGNRRLGLKLGGVFGLVRFHPPDKPERGWQLSFEGSIRGQFDRDHSTDNIGWDGVYGLQLAWRPGDNVAYRIAIHHNSAHVGDEYAERTGRERIDYTREELRAGVAVGLDTRWTGYVDVGWGYTLRNSELQKPGRVQAGLQYIHPPELFGGGFGAYGAVNINAFEENDWDAAFTAQAGITMPAGNRVWRAGMELYDGRSTMNEFFFRDERYLLLGVWLEL